MEKTHVKLAHVREIIKYLDYDTLEIDGDIPCLFDYVEKKTKKLPPWVYRNQSFSLFGMTMDYIIRKMLVTGLTGDKYKFETGKNSEMHILEKYNLNTKKQEIYKKCIEKYYDDNTKWLSVIHEAYQLAETHYLDNTQESVYSKEDLNSYIPSLQNIYKWLISEWVRLGEALEGTINFNKETNYEHITAHPDIVTDYAVIDIKTTTCFARMAKESFLQTLSYFALLRLTNQNMRYLGILLPIDKDILIFDLKTWDPTSFLNKLLNINMEMMTIEDLGLSIPKTKEDFSKYIGNHTSKVKTIVNSLEEHVNRKGIIPCQMFLRNSQNGSQGKLTEKELNSSALFIRKNKLIYFTHAAYVINLCRPISSKYPEDTKWALNLIINDLLITNFINGRGVVVHVGNSLTMSIDDALRKMRKNIRKVLRHATEKCPLILETPAGEGTELCSSLEGLSRFYNTFTNHEKKVFKVCIDTCHIYAAGYEPLDYILRWTVINGIESIALVHFNDSLYPKGARKDRHAPVGLGYIGSYKMSEIAKFCVYNKIPMIVE